MSGSKTDFGRSQGLAELIEQDLALRTILRTAAVLGQGILLQARGEMGISPSDAVAELMRTVAALPDTSAFLDERTARGYLKQVEDALDRYAALGADQLMAWQRASELARQDLPEATGWGGEAAKVIGAAALAAALLVGEAKLSAHLPLSAGGEVNLVAGVPEGAVPLVEAVGGLLRARPVTEGGNGQRGAGQKERENAPGLKAESGSNGDAVRRPGSIQGRQQSLEEKASAKDSARTPDRKPAAAAGPSTVPRSGRAQPDRGTSRRTDLAPMTYREALERRDEVLDRINGGRLLAFLRGNAVEDGDPLFVRQGKRRSDGSLMSFGAGVFRVKSDRSGSNYSHYRIGLRLQSSLRLTNRALNRAKSELDDIYPDQIAVRWTTPLFYVASPPRPMDWHVRPGQRVVLGAPLNTAGGALSSWAIVLKDVRSGEPYGLTAGHTIVDQDGWGGPGGTVFCPPQPRPPDDPDLAFGSVFQVETFPPFDPSTGYGPSGSGDFALVRLAHGRIPLPDEHRRAGTRTHSRAFAAMEDVRDHLPRMVKAVARTREAVGRFIQSDVRTEIVNPISGLIVLGDNLIEIELEDRFSTAQGDSGALVCVDEDGGMTPCGMMVAAATKASIVSTRTRTAVYALPLDCVTGIDSMEVW